MSSHRSPRSVASVAALALALLVLPACTADGNTGTGAERQSLDYKTVDGAGQVGFEGKAFYYPDLKRMVLVVHFDGRSISEDDLERIWKAGEAAAEKADLDPKTQLAVQFAAPDESDVL